MRRHEGGGAGRVDGDRGTLQPERVGDPAGHDAGQAAVAEITGHVLRHPAQPGAPVVVHHSGEDAGLGAPDRLGIDPGPLQRLPRGLQQQPLLRVHRLRLTRRDAEEAGVEQSCVVQEPAFVGVGLAGHSGLGVVDARDVPASVGGEPGDGVHLTGHQLPQRLRRGDAAGVAAGHAHDRDGLVGHRGRSDTRHRRLDTEGPFEQVVRERLGRGVVEHQRGGQLHAGRPGQPVAQVDRGQRVEPHVAEGPLRPDRRGVAVSEDSGHVLTHPVQRGPGSIALRQRGQAADERRHLVLALGRGSPYRGRCQGAQQVGQFGSPLRQRATVRLDGDQDGITGGQCLVEQGQVVGRGQPGETGGGHAGHGRVVKTGAHPAVGPQSPRQRLRRQTMSTPINRQRVQERIGRGVVALSGTVDQSGHGGEQHERRQLAIPGQLMQIPGRHRLGRQHRIQPLNRQRTEHTVIQNPRGMHHSTQLRQPGYEIGQRGPIGHITRHHPHPSTGLLQPGHQLTSTRRGQTPPTHQHQISHTMPADQMRGHQRTQPPGPPGDQHTARPPARRLRIGGRSRPRAGDRSTHQPRRQQHPVPHQQFRLTTTQHPRPRHRHLIRIKVQQHDPVRVLGLSRTHQTPHRRRRHIRDALTSRTPGHHHQPATLNRQPLLQPAQHRPTHLPDITTPAIDTPHHHISRIRRISRPGQPRRFGRLRQAQTEHIRTRQHHPAHRSRLTRGDRTPLHPIHRQRRSRAHTRHRTRHQRTDRRHRTAGQVGQFEGEGVRARRGDPDTQRPGAGGVEGDVSPGERHQRTVTVTGVLGGVQGCVEQRGVEDESVHGGVHRHLGEDLLTTAPRRLQPLEQRPVVVAALPQLVIEARDVDGLRARRRPLGQRGGYGSGVCGPQRAAGVSHPGVIL